MIKKMKLTNNPSKNTVVISIGAYNSTLTDGSFHYVNSSGSMSTTSGTRKVLIPVNGKIKKICLVTYAGTAGTNEEIKGYYSINGNAPVEFASVSSATQQRELKNEALNITIASTDYLEISLWCGNWATNPTNMAISGFIMIE